MYTLVGGFQARRGNTPDDGFQSYMQGNKSIGLPPIRAQGKKRASGFGGGMLVVLQQSTAAGLSADAKYTLQMEVSSGAEAGVRTTSPMSSAPFLSPCLHVAYDAMLCYATRLPMFAFWPK